MLKLDTAAYLLQTHSIRVQISVLKEKIEEEHKMPADSQKLIAYGKVMDDADATLKDYKIQDGGFIVCMVTKVSSNDNIQTEVLN